MTNTVEAPAELVEAYAIGDGLTVDYACQVCAREYATDHGLVWDNENTANYTVEREDGAYAYAIWYGDTESDYPQACCRCDTYLHTALTPDGEDYLRANYPGEWWSLWGVAEDHPTRENLTYLAHLAGYSLFCNGRCDSPRLEHTYIGYDPEEVLANYIDTHPYRSGE